jgi:PAS domain S-box-containing protein
MRLDADRVHVVGYRGYAERGLEEWVRHIDVPLEKMALLSHMVETGQPAVISDIDRDYPNWALAPEALWVKSYAGAPIQREGRVIGFLNLYGDVAEFFGPADADRLQAFADQVSIALRNAQLFSAEREQRALAEALRDTAAAITQTLDFDDVLDLILEYLGRVVPHDAANIMLIEDGIARVVRGQGYAEHGVEDWINTLRYVVKDIPTWQPMMDTGQPFAIPDVLQEPKWAVIPQEAWIRSTVKAPIRIEGRIVGVLHLDSATPGVFSQVHAERLQAFADQAAIALRNAQLFSAERDQRTLAEALRDTAAAINSSLNFDEVVEAILANVGRVAPYDEADLLLVEDGVGRVIGTYPTPTDPDQLAWLRDARLVVNDTPNLRSMVETGQPFVIADCYQYSGWIDNPETHWIGSNAAAPIRREGRVIGFLILNAAVPGFFTQEHANRLLAFADQVALAIHNAQLFAEVEQRVRERTLELERRRAELQAILDSIGEGVIYDEKLRVRYINRALTQLTGYATEEYTTYLGPLRSSQYTEEEYTALIRRIYDAIERLGVWRGEIRLRRKDGTEFDAALYVTPVRDLLDRVIGAVTVIRDISQEKALREQKDRFIASASHELRTPLANFKTRLYLLKNQPEKFEQHVAILNRVTNGMNELVENLLDVSRFERGVIPMHRRPVVLQEIVNDVASIQVAEAERRELALTIDLYPEPLRALVDPHRLAQVVTNLISNAINYTHPGGEIRVELVPDHEQVPRHALLRVRDTGIGIEPEMLAQVFEPFFRGSEEVGTGAGLGLTIAREIVKLHEGRLLVESEVGRGSVFTVVLDLLVL